MTIEFSVDDEDKDDERHLLWKEKEKLRLKEEHIRYTEGPGTGTKWGQMVSISANRSDEEPWRIDRLRRVVGYLEVHGHLMPLRNISHLSDHKGELTVTWRSEPCSVSLKAIRDAWENENETAMTFEYVGYEKVEGDIVRVLFDSGNYPLVPGDPIVWRRQF